MTTALEFITDATEEIGYKAAEVPLEADDIRGALRRLNALLSEWEPKGLGAAPVMDAADTVRIAKENEYALMVNLAGRLAPFFRRPISPELAASIKASNKALLRQTAVIGEVKFPDTLPKGSGNHCDSSDDRFFEQNNRENF